MSKKGATGAVKIMAERLAKELNFELVDVEFKKEGPIEGSWIESTPIHFHNFAFETDAYKGGISRYEDNDIVTYEFLTDAQTGTVLKMNRV